MFYVIALDLIRILRSWASQNDRQILSFMKGINIVGKNWPETVVKWSTPSVVWFVSTRSLEIGNIRFILLPVYNHIIKIEAARKYYRLSICNILSHFFNGLCILILPDYPGCFISLRDCLFWSLEYTNSLVNAGSCH